MAGWKLAYARKALKDLSGIDKPERSKIVERLEWSAEHFNELETAPLHGEWRGFYKLRIGDWRVVYEYNNAALLITVHQIGRRDKVYKHK